MLQIFVSERSAEGRRREWRVGKKRRGGFDVSVQSDWVRSLLLISVCVDVEVLPIPCPRLQQQAIVLSLLGQRN